MGRTIEQWLEVLGETPALDEEAAANLKEDLAAAKQKTDALQTEFDELNHMLTHQPPSAWAKREKKYHDDKKLWDSAQAELTGKVKRLNEEVRTLKDNNRAVILQEQLQEAEASYKELKKEHEDVNKKLADKTAAHKSLLEEHAKINKAHQEAVQESVTARMSMRKLEEALAKKTSEAVAEQSKAAESSRLLSSLRRDFNESSLKSDGLKEQLEGLRAAQSAAQKKMAGEIDALNKEVQAATEKASAEAASHAAAAAQIAELSSQLDSLRAENGEVNDAAKEAEQERADEAKKALAKLNDMHQAELTAVKRQLIGLEDRCQSLMTERTTLQKQLRSARTEHDAALRAAKTAAAAAAAGVSEEAAVDAALSAAAGARAAAASPARKVNSSWTEQDAAGVLRAPGSRSPSPRARASPARTAAAAPDAATPDAKSTVPRSGSGEAPGTVPEARDAIEAKGATLPATAPEAATSPLKAQASAVSVDSGGLLSVTDAAVASSAAAPPPAVAEPAAASTDVSSPDAAVPSADVQPLTAEALEARDSVEAAAQLTLDMPALQINTNAQADMSKPENVGISAQMDAWQHACGVVLPPAERAALIASGHAQVLSDTLSALDRENTAHAQARMRACACKIASSVPMASRPTEYSGGQILPPKMGLPKSGMTVLRAAARARADRAMVADEMDAEAVAREAAGEAAIASAFARAMAADDAHNDRRLVAVANAVALSEGTGHNGQPLSRERIGLLRAAAMRSSENAKAWKGLPADEDFLEAFSVAMVSSSVPLPSGDVISIPEEQRLLFQTAGAAVLGADGDAQGAAADAVGALHPESSGGGEGDSDGDVLAVTRSLQKQQSFVVQRDATGQLDLSSLPNNATGRALREYAAQCETTVQVHQAQVEQLNRQLADKDKELAAMEESLDILAPVDSNGERALKGNLSAADAQRLEALQDCISSGSTKQASRIKSLEANLVIAEQNLSNCKGKLKDMGVEEEDVAALTNPSAADSLILSGNEDNYLTTLVVKLKVDLAETHGELMHCKRALTRAKESETKLLEKVAMLEVPLAPAPPTVTQPRRTSLFTPRMNMLANTAVAEVPEETEPPVDTQAHDELSAPEINIGDGVTRELDESFD